MNIKHSGRNLGDPIEVAIVGGGISGLATCYYLNELTKHTEQEIHLTLIESGDSLGGKIVTDYDNGMTIEGGPDSFFTQKPWALELCADLGLTESLVAANPDTKGTYVLNGEKMSKLPPGTETGTPSKLMPLMHSDLLSITGKLRTLMDLVIPRRKEIIDESVGSFITRRFGRQFLEKIAEPLFAGIFAGDVDQLSAQAILPSLKDLELAKGSLILGILRAKKNIQRTPRTKASNLSSPTFVTLKGGLAQLVGEMVSRLDHSSVMLKTRVTALSEPSQQHEGLLEIMFERGKKMQADIVVLATPAYVTAELIKQFEEEAASILETIPYVSTATVSLAFNKNELDAKIEGHGFLVPRKEGELVTGCTWESSKWPGHAPSDVVLARCYVGWAGHEEFVQYEDNVLVSKVQDFLLRAVGISARPFFTRVYRWKAALPQYTVGHVERIAMLEQAMSKHKGLYITGAAYHGVGLPDCIHNASLTAQQIVKAIQDNQLI